ncbi:MAG: hypothetical protein PHU93_00920 [Candidatus Gracilibacteria bacterium]|nr:hypothetical protein [Candidatus Gracilibacteria bacterium]
MQISQRNRGPESHNVAQERNEHLTGLKNATNQLHEGGVQKAQQRTEGSQMYRNLNTGNVQPKNMADLMQSPDGRKAVNQILAQKGLPSFQDRTDWVGNNPALAREVFDMARSSGPNAQPRTQPNIRVNSQQHNARAYGSGASNSAGEIGG